MMASHHARVAQAIYERGATNPNATSVDGASLSIGAVVAVATRDDAEVVLDSRAIPGIAASLDYLLERSAKSVYYGVSTGFGASATTRTNNAAALQLSIAEHLLAGVHGVSDFVGADTVFDPPSGDAMPECLVRAAILVRLNTLARGHSGVRPELLHKLSFLLNAHLTPVVPLRGSISASGDLSPLGYVAGAICAHPDVQVIERGPGKAPAIMSCGSALLRCGVRPIELGPKEGLALVNGTAFSAAAAALAIYDSHVLALMSQVLSAMTAEALLGQAGAFHPWLHKVARPHPGQIEAAQNMGYLLSGSKLVEHHDNVKGSGNSLRQDRYAIRTAPQWIGPQLEDLIAAHETVTIELNSSTDNPLIDIDNDIVHHGGNFQATAITNAMDKTRLSLAALGKLCFAQVTELNNSHQNKGLPSCLAGDEPSTNYHTKGLDTISAGYTAELQYLANPVLNHVQSAEQHNQSVNSLALISARKTMEAAHILQILMAGHLYCLCQAVDLRALEIRFMAKLRPALDLLLVQFFGDKAPLSAKAVLDSASDRLTHTASMDSPGRFADAFDHASSVIVKSLASNNVAMLSVTENIVRFNRAATVLAVDLIRITRDEYFASGSAALLLGKTGVLYNFVRQDLGVKMRRGDVATGKTGISVGREVTKIARVLRSDGPMPRLLVELLKGAQMSTSKL